MRSTIKTLWIGTQPNADDRTLIQVSQRDYDRIPARGMLGEAVTVKDLSTERRVTLRRAPCAINGCVCALEFANWEGRRPMTTTHASFGRMPRERDEEIYRDHLITKQSDGFFKVTKDGQEIATRPTSEMAKAKVDVVLDFSG